MRLIEYIVQRHIKQVEFAKKVGVTNVYLGEILRGRRPSIKLAQRIEEATAGEVSKEEIIFPDEH